MRKMQFCAMFFNLNVISYDICIITLSICCNFMCIMNNKIKSLIRHEKHFKLSSYNI